MFWAVAVALLFCNVKLPEPETTGVCTCPRNTLTPSALELTTPLAVISFPTDNMLRVSDGKWTTRNLMRVNSVTGFPS